MHAVTPKDYWRVARQLGELEGAPSQELVWPNCIGRQKQPPRAGDGVMLAAYDRVQQAGLIRYLGIVCSSSAGVGSVRWTPVDLELWVDTGPGRGFWQDREGFKFAPKKVPGYGLHEMFARHFEGLTAREALPDGCKTVPSIRRTPRGGFAPERFLPAELIGEPNDSARGGYVYVLESAYGCKVGRTRDIPSRMRAFGVKLPIAYSIRLCVWFDDHYEAETRYHEVFRDKHINGEWFALQEADIELIRGRTYGSADFPG